MIKIMEQACGTSYTHTVYNIKYSSKKLTNAELNTSDDDEWWVVIHVELKW